MEPALVDAIVHVHSYVLLLVGMLPLLTSPVADIGLPGGAEIGSGGRGVVLPR